MTSVQAAKALGLAVSTTRNAAARGEVPGAHKDAIPGPGQLKAPWVATEEAWRAWAANIRPRTKRVSAPTLSEKARRFAADVAARADHLNGRQLRGYSPQRQEEIDRLQEEWRVVRGLADRTEQKD